MRLLKAHIENFGSYKEFDFDFTNQGLTLICGPTGSGKSTLQDISAWILYGVTSKNGAVDDVRSWFSLDSKTLGTLDVELPNGTIKVTRIRGTSHENDLYWTEEHTPDRKERGKDLKDTQIRLAQRLGIAADLYCTASTFNEFSDAATFFLAKAKDKRAILERIANLSLSVKLAERVNNARRETKKELETVSNDYTRTAGGYDKLVSSLPNIYNRSNEWERSQQKRIQDLEEKSKNFEKEKEDKISRLAQSILDLDNQRIPTSKQCPTCGTELKNHRATEVADSIKRSKKEDLERRIEGIRASTNTYGELIENISSGINPFIEQAEQMKSDIAEISALINGMQDSIKSLESRICSLEQLYDLSLDLRGILLRNVVEVIQNNTNDYLERYFDSALRIHLTIPDSETIDASIQKNGYAAVYRQLSKGQRQMLRLCFSIAMMEASANNTGIHISTLLFDESLDGMDTELKLKAFGLFSELEKTHESVLVIDHSEELKEMFSNRYEIDLAEDQSRVHNASSI